MFVLPSMSRGLRFWCVNHTSIYENCESNVFKKINFSGEISNNWPNDLLGSIVYKTITFSW